MTLQGASDMSDWLLQMEKLVKMHGAGHDMDNYSAICVQIK